MANWTMKVNDRTYESPMISVGLWSAVATVLGDKATDFDALAPYRGPDQAAAWYAVLAADSSDDKAVQKHLQDAMAMPLVRLISMINVET